MSQILFYCLFYAPILLVIIEGILYFNWNPSYFRSGIVIFKRTYTTSSTQITSISDLEKVLKKSSLFDTATSMVFRKLSHNEYAFREKIFEINLLNSTPVMHGLLILQPDSGSITVIGYSNWATIFFAVLLGVALLNQRYLGFVFVGFLLLILYFIQMKRFEKVGNAASKLSLAKTES